MADWKSREDFSRPEGGTRTEGSFGPHFPF